MAFAQIRGVSWQTVTHLVQQLVIPNKAAEDPLLWAEIVIDALDNVVEVVPGHVVFQEKVILPIHGSCSGEVRLGVETEDFGSGGIEPVGWDGVSRKRSPHPLAVYQRSGVGV